MAIPQSRIVNGEERYQPYNSGTGSNAALSLNNAKVASAAPSDTTLSNGTVTFYLDEVGNKLTVRVRYSDGTLKTGTVALT